ncbi:aspartyl protease family protein [Vibrio sp. Of7-15]|uniref:aspartyl protease family protein n=1 Tax=Vibrio sp. Of7-15 TaxID=2724879 RepID=UPI001EF223E6|nr:aspartyl protease family protein [Vibrio sp. Of7-15]MCG7497710.1 aspartyl protease family protein [Vibrio sp. Of7-15]
MNFKKSKLYAFLSLSLGIITHAELAYSQHEFYTDKHNVILDTNFEESLIIPVTIANKTYSFMVDTGASVTIINSHIANEITEPVKLNALPEHHQKDFGNIRAVSGTLQQNSIHFLKPVPISLGEKTISDHEIWIAIDMSLVSQAVGTDIDGIIGIDTFRQMNWLVDNSTKRLTITSSALPSSQFDQCIGYSDNYNRSPVLNLTYANGEVAMNVDTGASNGYVGQEFIDYLLHNTQLAEKIPHASLSVDAIGFNHTDEYVLNDLEFNGMPLGGLQISGNPGEQYALGMDFFSRFQQYAFMPSRMLFCYNAETIKQKWQKPHRTIYVRYANDNLEVFYNAEAMLADHGLKNGDIILKANGKSYKPPQIGKLNDILSYTPKGELSLTIQRGEEVKTFQI